MIVSWNWLKEYVALSMSPDELTHRLTLSGLNLEGSERIGEDLAIDLEVTSNRPDCLGHIGVAREIAVLFGGKFTIPRAEPKAIGPPVENITRVSIDCPALCTRYTARVIQGVQIGPSPSWLAARLRSIGIAVINNVVDVSNYVMMECGQPLHVFDFAKLAGHRILVREARPGETFLAIDHREYELSPGICVIADAARGIALAGVMGGAESEVSESTTDLLIESADFNPLSIRSTARKLNLQSPSSYRFERGVDPVGVDWASRRCCELILELAGGKLAKGVIDAGMPPQPRQPIVLRLAQLERILGIAIPPDKVRQILVALGNNEVRADAIAVEVIPPSWRADLTREIDLVEEVARIHGYDAIPEDVGVPLAASSRSMQDQVIERIQQILVAAGYHEAMTISAVEEDWIALFRPWCRMEPLRVSTPVLRRADCLRQSLIPSLLASRRTNETLSNPRIELFEIAKVYLPRQDDLPDERWMVGLTSGQDYRSVKGVLEAIVQAVAPLADLHVTATTAWDFLESAQCSEIRLGDQLLGYLGQVSAQGLDRFELRNPTTVAELDLGVLINEAELIRKVEPLSPYPPVDRDLNVVLDESVLWADVERLVRESAGNILESLAFQEVYRDSKRLGPGKKSLLLNVRLRSHQGTFTNEEADAIRDRIVARLAKELGGQLRA
ncbi:MAG: phenylalanine--tRNA ligase subunit beta [Pirellulales bacterium]|nr:phenylalanine--tRNA ligase subunit beta [Pirellulales bacterium]